MFQATQDQCAWLRRAAVTEMPKPINYPQGDRPWPLHLWGEPAGDGQDPMEFIYAGVNRPPRKGEYYRDHGTVCRAGNSQLFAYPIVLHRDDFVSRVTIPAHSNPKKKGSIHDVP